MIFLSRKHSIHKLQTMMSKSVIVSLASVVLGFAFINNVGAFSPVTPLSTRIGTANKHNIVFSSESDEFVQETPEQTQKRIGGLVEEHPVLLFMKGTKIFLNVVFLVQLFRSSIHSILISTL